MKSVQIHAFEMRSPDDTRALEQALEVGAIEGDEIVCILVKTEGNGLANDFTRALAEISLLSLLCRHLHLGRDDVEARISLICSGGTEGVLSPHMTVVCVSYQAGGTDVGSGPRLAFGHAHAQRVVHSGVGIDETAQRRAITAAVNQAMIKAGLYDHSAVHLVLVKAALPAGLEAGAQQQAKPALRAASALGVAVALAELSPEHLHDLSEVPRSAWSSRACVTAASDLACSEIVVFGNSPAWGGELVAGHTILADMLDSPSVARLLKQLGYDASPQLNAVDTAAVKAVVLKGEPPRSDIRGHRHTMWDDSDINALRHYRSAMGALLSGLLGCTRHYLSAGAEHQGPPGGANLCVIMQAPASPTHNAREP
ncbi:ring-opening amidohydrolase [Allohahella marinimesophila]